MGDYKKTHCKQGHELTDNNVIKHDEGFRECKICKYARRSRPKIRERNNFKAFVASLTLSGMYGDILVGQTEIETAKRNARLFAKASESTSVRSREIWRAAQRQKLYDSTNYGSESIQEIRKYGASS
jgi:hypothetical protein